MCGCRGNKAGVSPSQPVQRVIRSGGSSNNVQGLSLPLTPDEYTLPQAGTSERRRIERLKRISIKESLGR